MTTILSKSNLLASMGKGAEAKKVKVDVIAKGTNAELNHYEYQLVFWGKMNSVIVFN